VTAPGLFTPCIFRPRRSSLRHLPRFGINVSDTRDLKLFPSSPSPVIKCNATTNDGLCHACQLGGHIRLPFHASSSHATHNFQLIHCDLWTSPVVSVSGHKYYLVILDDCSHYLWTFPLCLKSDTFSTLSNFFAYVRTQFGATIRGV